MNEERIMEIIKKHLEQAEKDMKACGRGSNHGRVVALRSLLAELEEEKK